jgi:glycine C-acetyltransferase
MSDQAFYGALQQKLDTLRTEGLFKPERVLASRQGAVVEAQDGRTLINMCANNYLGLSGDAQTSQAAAAALEKYGYGLSSVRFICGTQTVHKELEAALSRFLGTEDRP